ncbi:DEAD/DEAH box helicase [Nocardioides massiliensis]|uniref:DEAD/DEAH box helicase domain-containing protein n=1 Tax=Nocardioides massiliensis TaxID=1325935 RepID=A0ABT9NL38_9ACTN|nr:DEAD/DEAH box helicase [Nocardioides massiliensis]MDP9820937.1 DEAD/DEAH box helicase domain-containing protein [Nocardioides massiliensis]
MPGSSALAAVPSGTVGERVLARAGDRVVHRRVLPPRAARATDWPAWVPPTLRTAYAACGVQTPWIHQAEAMEHAHAGRHVVLSTGTASGKSLAYQVPALTAVLEARRARNRRGAGVLYIAPTKALAQDQLAALLALDVPALAATTYDGDTPREARTWARDHGEFLLTNPDMLHRSLLPGHESWARFLGMLRYVVVDECHHYRGVFGAHVAHVLRRLRRICRLYGSDPTFVLASATVAEPATSASRLVGAPVLAVTDDGSPRGPLTLAMWEPPLTPGLGENGAPVRRPAGAEAADVLTDLVVDGVRTLAFSRSRRGVETIALSAQRALAEVDPVLRGRVAAYRGGYLPEERRALEQRLRSGDLLGLAATNALELGIDVSGLDAVLVTGYPGTRAAFWQQVGRAGRGGQQALGVFVGRDDPLDTYLLGHPDALLGAPVEATVFDVENPYVVGPHLCAAAQEVPLTPADVAAYGPTAHDAVEALAGAGLLRWRDLAKRPGWYWTDRQRACDLADIRSSGGAEVRLLESGTGRVVGTVSGAAAHAQAHPGAVYLHAGESWVVDELDLADGVAVMHRDEPTHTTTAREVTDITILDVHEQVRWGAATVATGRVRVTSQVVAYLVRDIASGAVLAENPLDLPPRELETTAVWWCLPDEVVAEAGISAVELPGAVHAAEHAAIGLLPLFATCDRWDIGGVSTALHPDTAMTTVFVHDGHPGGAGFAERGYAVAPAWLRATREAIAQCGCPDGCPSCVQSPKCGNGNHPLDKAAALAVLDVLLEHAPVGV